MARIFKTLTHGKPLDGQGDAYYLAGTIVDKIKRVYMGPGEGGNPNAGSDTYVLKADVEALGYKLTAGAPTDKTEELVAASVDADSILVTS